MPSFSIAASVPNPSFHPSPRSSRARSRRRSASWCSIPCVRLTPGIESVERDGDRVGRRERRAALVAALDEAADPLAPRALGDLVGLLLAEHGRRATGVDRDPARRDLGGAAREARGAALQRAADAGPP